MKYPSTFLGLWCALCVLVLAEEIDYYKLLDIERDADNREIRRAFKKLALKMHPDKNPVRTFLVYLLISSSFVC